MEKYKCLFCFVLAKKNPAFIINIINIIPIVNPSTEVFIKLSFVMLSFTPNIGERKNGSISLYTLVFITISI